MRSFSVPHSQAVMGVAGWRLGEEITPGASPESDNSTVLRPLTICERTHICGPGARAQLPREGEAAGLK